MNPGPPEVPAPPAPLAEQAYRRILERLETGDPGQRLVEQELADALSMSRTPVRDALRRLAAEGVIRRTSGRSYVARQFSLRDVLDLYDLRILLEPEAAALGAQRAGADEAARLEGLTAAAGTADFHAAVAAACGNRALELVIGILLGYPTGQVGAGGGLGHAESASDGHARIIAGIREHHPDEAAAAMREHLEALREAAQAGMTGGGPR
jgi:DNA-binding GntR family transcriptional regulator